MLNKTCFRLLGGGIAMLCVSGIIFGGFIHTLIMNPANLGYITFFAFSGASTLVTGVLMMFDCMKHKIREEIRRASGERTPETYGDIEEEDVEYMDKLASEVEKLRPQNIEKSRKQ